jgi:hypothetical protein
MNYRAWITVCLCVCMSVTIHIIVCWVSESNMIQNTPPVWLPSVGSQW